MNSKSVPRQHIGTYNEYTAVLWLLSQGYEVFRNVSPYGPVDIVAMKDGKLTLFDAKKADYQDDGSIRRPKLKQLQKELGVLCLCVFEDGTCIIDERPRFEGDTEQACEHCGEMFPMKPYRKQRFCSPSCKAIFAGETIEEQPLLVSI